MKLLTWMHRKFRQGSTETLKEFPLGQSLLDDHQVYQRQNQRQARKSFACLETTRREDLEEKACAEFSEYFEGFLAIGTLGTTETVMSEPETPTFAVSFEKLAEGETEVTETELRLINDELERVLAAEAYKEDGWTDSSGRNSHVSNGRISHASSTITLSGKPLEISETTATVTPTVTATESLVCPLQEYLLGSAVELPEKVTVPKKEHRMSLGELFERHKAEEVSETKCKRGEKREDKEGDKNSMNLMKKILKKKIANHASSRSSSAGTRGTTDSASAETKLCKILHKFHKKVHPECLTTTEKSHKIGIKDMLPCNNGGYYKEGHTLGDESITTMSQKAFRNGGYMRHNKSRSNPTHFIVGSSDDYNESRECWIKTDADYLVLEL